MHEELLRFHTQDDDDDLADALPDPFSVSRFKFNASEVDIAYPSMGWSSRRIAATSRGAARSSGADFISAAAGKKHVRKVSAKTSVSG
jgi:hypothetical protein